jgi:aspartate/methionine/tyrosine aminotransferase
MTYEPSIRWRNYKPRKRTFSRYAKARSQIEKKGEKVLRVTAGDPVVWGFDNHEMNEYIIKAVKDGWNGYVSPGWLGKVKENIVDFEKRMRDCHYSPDNVLVSPGCANALFSIHYAILNSGDEVIAPDPSHYLGAPTNYWPCFGAKAVACPSNQESGWIPDIDDMRSRISDNTKAIFLNNPNNPTGANYDEKFLKDVVNLAGEHDLLLIGDEIYGLIVFDGKKAVSLGAVAEDVPAIVMNGLSKYFIAPGWRFGYVCLHDPEEKATDLMNTVLSSFTAYGHSTRSIASPVLVAVTEAFANTPMKASINLIEELEKRRDYIVKRIEELEGLSVFKPEATLYAFPKIDLVPSKWSSDEEFLIDLLKEQKLFFNDGASYGESGLGHFRTLLMPNLEIQEDIWNRIESFLNKNI